MDKRDGNYMILPLKKSLFLEMCIFMTQYFLLHKVSLNINIWTSNPWKEPKLGFLFNDPLHVHDDGHVISMRENHARPAHHSPQVIEHASSVQMPAMDRGTDDDSVATPPGPNVVAPTLGPLPAIRAGAPLSGPTEAYGPSNETTEELVIQGEPTTGRPQCHRRPPARLHDYVCHAITHPSSSLLHESSSSTTYPLSHCLTYEHFLPSYRAFLVSITSQSERQHISQALYDSNWLEAMKKEIDALEENQTWEFTSLLVNVPWAVSGFIR